MEQEAIDAKPVVVSRRCDGGWQATVVCCSNAGTVDGYTIAVTGQVKDGIFHAEFGVEGQPG